MSIFQTPKGIQAQSTSIPWGESSSLQNPSFKVAVN